MRPSAALFVTFLVLMVSSGVLYLVYRLRRLAADRADAKVRAAAALEEMTRFTRELQQRQGDAPNDDTSLSAGERLRRCYPGQAPRALS
ncbi:MAG TPA: hypothetical protein VIC55_05070 [Gemmatimonadaceae bacterium]|jgi:hypothetical protein